MLRYTSDVRKPKEIISLILLTKIGIFLLIIFAYFLLPFDKLYYLSNFIYPPHSPITLQTAFSTWDAQHYLYLSEKGYRPGNIDSNAFAPLFPFLIFLGKFIFRNSFISGLILTNAFSALGLYFFYVLIARQLSEQVAYRSLLFLLAFPTAFYFSLIYTESLFFLLVVLFFLFLQKKKIFLASLIAFFLPLARTIGIAIFLPFLSSLILEINKHSLYDEVKDIVKSLLHKKSLLIFSPFLGILSLLIFMYFATGNAYSQFIAQHDFLANHSFFSVLNLSIFFKQLFIFPLTLHGYTNSLLDRLFFFAFLFLLPALFRRVSKTFFIYAIIFGLLPVLSGSFMSYTRYLLVVFPIFIALGKMSLEKKYQSYVFPFIFASMLLQSLFIIMQALNHWVA